MTTILLSFPNRSSVPMYSPGWSEALVLKPFTTTGQATGEATGHKAKLQGYINPIARPNKMMLLDNVLKQSLHKVVRVAHHF